MALAASSARSSSTTVVPSTAATLSSFGWLIIAQMTFGGGTFVVAMMRARQFSLQEFAAYALATTCVAFFSVLADFGLSTMMIRDFARRGTNIPRYMAASLSLTTGLAVVAATCVFATSFFFAQRSQLNVIAGVLGLNLVISGFSMAPNAYLRAIGRTQFEALARVVTALSSIGLCTLAIVLHGGIVSIAWMTVLATLMGTGITSIAAFSHIGVIRPRIDLKHSRGLLKDSAPLGAGMIFTAVYYYSDSMMLGAFGQHEALARYSAAYVFVLAASLFITAMRNAFLPAQSRAYAAERSEEPALRTYFRLTLACAAAAILVGPLIAEPLLRLSYGNDYASGANALRILFVTTGVMLLASYYGSHLLMGGKQRAYLAATAGGAVVNVLLCLVLIPRFSLVGAASATLATEIAVCLCLAANVRALRR